MSGPIVRSGPSPEFSRNWESVFGKKSGGKANGASGGVKKSNGDAGKPAKKASGKPVSKATKTAGKKGVAKKAAGKKSVKSR